MPSPAAPIQRPDFAAGTLGTQREIGRRVTTRQHHSGDIEDERESRIDEMVERARRSQRRDNARSEPESEPPDDGEPPEDSFHSDHRHTA
jgi:hypothetical protein